MGGREACVQVTGTVVTGCYKVLNLFCFVAGVVRLNVRDLRVCNMSWYVDSKSCVFLLLCFGLSAAHTGS